MRLELEREAPQVDPWVKGLLAAIGVAAVLAARLFPFSALPTMCAFKLVSGQPCLACGMTRSWIHMAHGRVGAAFVQNPLGTALFVTLAGTVLYLAVRTVASSPAVRLKASSKEAWVLRVVVITLTVVNWLYVVFSGVA